MCKYLSKKNSKSTNNLQPPSCLKKTAARRRLDIQSLIYKRCFSERSLRPPCRSTPTLQPAYPVYPDICPPEGEFYLAPAGPRACWSHFQTGWISMFLPSSDGIAPSASHMMIITDADVLERGGPEIRQNNCSVIPNKS